MSHVPPYAVLVSHTVSDFDTWKKAFDAHQPARKAAGILGHHLNRGPGGEVAIYLAATDRGALAAFLSSPDTKAVMADAGVTSAPRFEWLAPIEDGHIGDRPTASMIVSHRVADFAAWKKVYDAVEPLRRDHGVIGASVNQSLDDPNEVVIYHQAKTQAELEAFAASPRLKEAMQAGGVTSKPEFRFLEAMPGAAY